ncbi:MAG: hypothetical protein LUI39_03000 [Lachnospiraceae bacterium]|nr:hypothetical protein [Lachnospiraceae bacterium]
MKKNNSCYLKGMFALFGAAALSISFFFLLSRWNAVKEFFCTLVGILMPFIIGGVLAWLLTPICNVTETWLSSRLQKRKKGRNAAKGLSILITLFFAVFVVFTLLIMVIPALLENVYSVLRQIPDSVQSFNNWAMELAGDNATLQNYINDLSEAVSTDLPEWINDTVLPGLQTLIGEVSAGVVRFAGMLYNLLIGVIVSVYLLGCRKTFARQGKSCSTVFSRKSGQR